MKSNSWWRGRLVSWLFAGSILSLSAEQCVASVGRHWGTDDCEMVSWVCCSSPLKDSVSHRKEASAAATSGWFCHIDSISLAISQHLKLLSFLLSFLSFLPLAESQWWSGRHSHEKCPCACVLSPTSREGPNYEGMLCLLAMQSRKGTWNKQRIWVTKPTVFTTICILLTLCIPNFHFLFFFFFWMMVCSECRKTYFRTKFSSGSGC